MVYVYGILFALNTATFFVSISANRADLVVVNVFGMIICAVGIMYKLKKENSGE